MISLFLSLIRFNNQITLYNEDHRFF